MGYQVLKIFPSIFARSKMKTTTFHLKVRQLLRIRDNVKGLRWKLNCACRITINH